MSTKTKAPDPAPADSVQVTELWQAFGRTQAFRDAVKWAQDGEIPGALFVAYRAGLHSRPSAIPAPEGVPQGAPAETFDVDALTDLIAEHTRGVYHCTRVWEAWQVGTMGEDDFEPYDESESPRELAEAIAAKFAAPGTQAAPAPTAAPEAPAGQKLVPMKLTPEMRRAGAALLLDSTHEDEIDAGWTAMLAAAPQPAPAPACTCPSGDGSLRWPCPAHPSPAEGDVVDLIEAVVDAANEMAWAHGDHRAGCYQGEAEGIRTCDISNAKRTAFHAAVDALRTALASRPNVQPKHTASEFTNELGNAIRITIEGPTSTSENVLTPMEADKLRSALNEHAAQAPAPAHATFRPGDLVRKTSGSEWAGRIVGTYSTTLTPEGYAVESEAHAGSVQIYPAKALTLMDAAPTPAVGDVELVAVIGEGCGGVADGAEVIKQRLADALCAVVDGSGLKRKDVAHMLGMSEANLSIKLNGDTNLTVMSVANICGAVGANLSFRVEARHA